MPLGLSLDPATGTISGTPVAAGTSAFHRRSHRRRAPPGPRLALDHRGRQRRRHSTPPPWGWHSTPDGGGYWLADSAGAVRTLGDAGYYGSMAGARLNQPIDHIVSTADGRGYWLVAADGGTFAFGDAPFYGSMAGARLNAPIVDIAPTGDGRGYWLVAADGGVFAFGDARFHGSMGGVRPQSTHRGHGRRPRHRRLLAGGLRRRRLRLRRPFFGSTGALQLNQPVNGMAATPDDRGYWFVAADGGIFAFGDARFHGSTGSIALVAPVVGMAADPRSGGYWLVASDGGVFAFDAAFFGSGAAPSVRPESRAAIPTSGHSDPRLGAFR